MTAILSTTFLSLPQTRVLEAIGRFRCLTVALATRYLYEGKSDSAVEKAFSELTKSGYLEKVQFSQNHPGIWLLTAQGRNLLIAGGMDLGTRKHHREPDTYIFLTHALAANAAVIAAVTLPRSLVSLSVSGFLTEAELRRLFLPATPDGWVDLSIEGRPDPTWLEVDRGTETITMWRKKVAAIVGFYEGGRYAEVFGTRLLRVATFAPTEHRRDLLATWTKAELSAIGKASWADNFFFTACPASGESLEVFFGDHWVTAAGTFRPLFRGGNGHV